MNPNVARHHCIYTCRQASKFSPPPLTPPPTVGYLGGSWGQYITCAYWGSAQGHTVNVHNQKFVQSSRFQPDMGSVWIVTSNSMMRKAPPDNKSCILLGLLSVDFFSGVAWLTGSSSMVGRPSEDQPCERNRKWKEGFMSVNKTNPTTGRVG